MTWPPDSLDWRPQAPRLRPVRLLAGWLVSALALILAAQVLPGVAIDGFWGAVAVAAAIALLNAFLPPLVAALRLPATLITGLLALIVLNALMIQWASDLTEHAITVDGFGWAVLMALVTAAFSVALSALLGIDDDETYALHVTGRIARRQGRPTRSDAPGLVFLEIDGLAAPILRQAMQDGSGPTLASWLTSGTHALFEWETDLSSQTVASQAGILLGSNADIPAFRWVEKERGVLMSCSNPQDCAEIEARRADGRGLLSGGGASRGNLLSGEADEQILTVSRMAAEIRANPGYRSFLANGYNVSRCLALFAWEVALELLAAARQRRRDVRPRGHRGGSYPLLRGAMCVVVRDLIVRSVLTDMMRGRPAVDEVAHHSGLRRADTLEALRKLDQQFARIDAARAYAPRPYEIVVLSDHGQTQGATFRQRNGYGLDDLVERHLEQRGVLALGGGDENASAVGRAFDEATGRTARTARKPRKNDVSGRDAVVLGSGNLGLVYLMEEPRRLTLEEIEQRHPRLIGALRTDGFEDVADIMVGSFYDPVLDEGCAFEELISFHGGLGGPQTRPFVLHPVNLPAPAEPIVGAERLHEHLAGWRAGQAGGSLRRDTR